MTMNFSIEHTVRQDMMESLAQLLPLTLIGRTFSLLHRQQKDAESVTGEELLALHDLIYEQIEKRGPQPDSDAEQGINFTCLRACQYMMRRAGIRGLPPHCKFAELPDDKFCIDEFARMADQTREILSQDVSDLSKANIGGR